MTRLEVFVFFLIFLLSHFSAISPSMLSHHAMTQSNSEATILINIDIKKLQESSVFQNFKLSDAFSIESETETERSEETPNLVDTVEVIYAAIGLPTVDRDTFNFYAKATFTPGPSLNEFELQISKSTQVKELNGKSFYYLDELPFCEGIFFEFVDNEVIVATENFLAVPPNELVSSEVKSNWAAITGRPLRVVVDSSRFRKSVFAQMTTMDTDFQSIIEGSLGVLTSSDVVVLSSDLHENILDLKISTRKGDDVSYLLSGMLFQCRQEFAEFLVDYQFKQPDLGARLAEELKLLRPTREANSVSIALRKTPPLEDLLLEINRMILESTAKPEE